VLAHVRTNDREVGGVPSLHIEEIQSDWHQQGRKQGYQTPANDERLNKIAKEYYETNVDEAPGSWDKLPDAEKQTWLKEARAWTLDQRTGGVPDAPFKTAWPELALKRMIRMAAEEGKTRISWTPGEAQAARYDLSKQVNRIEYEHNPGTDKYHIAAWDKNNQAAINKHVTKNELPDIIGKELTDKILKGEGKTEGAKQSGHKYFEGVDLKVGGEGMKGFYDTMLPKMVEKLGKPYGVKVKQTELPLEEGIVPVKNPTRTKIWYFDIPPAMRDHALHRGFNLFQSGIPFPLVPVDYDPFKKDK
jgi:hypothetical protein